MRNKETGEFELVVGNGQLVSGFFIVVVLFAVGVAMGYILGQNSEKSAKSQQTAEAAPCVPGDSRPQPASQASSQPAAPAPVQSQSASDTPPQPTTQPAREPEPPPASSAPPKQEPPKPAPQPAAPPAQNAVADSAEPPSGFFWQVTARANQEAARATLRVLKERGFPAYMTKAPNGMTRVLVGPYKDTTSKAKAKSELDAMGLPPVPLTRE